MKENSPTMDVIRVIGVLTNPFCCTGIATMDSIDLERRFLHTNSLLILQSLHCETL